MANSQIKRCIYVIFLELIILFPGLYLSCPNTNLIISLLYLYSSTSSLLNKFIIMLFKMQKRYTSWSGLSARVVF